MWDSFNDCMVAQRLGEAPGQKKTQDCLSRVEKIHGLILILLCGGGIVMVIENLFERM